MDEIEEGVGALKAKLGRILTKPKVFFAGLALGGVIVAVLFITIFNNGKAAGAKETTPNTLSPSVVFERIASQNEMVSASQNYTIVDKVTDTKRFSIGLISRLQKTVFGIAMLEPLRRA